jgi:hypothetical protein
VNKAVGQAVSLPRVGSVVAVARVNHSLPQRKRRSRSNDSAVREPTPASRSAAEAELAGASFCLPLSA